MLLITIKLEFISWESSIQLLADYSTDNSRFSLFKNFFAEKYLATKMWFKFCIFIVFSVCVWNVISSEKNLNSVHCNNISSI